MSTESTQLTAANGYDTSRMVFSEPIEGNIPGNGPSISFKRINISTRNPDGSVGELIIPTERLFSFGVSENISMDSGKVNGYTMPLCMWNRDGPTDAEKAWTDTFDNIIEACTQHLLDNKDAIDKFDLDRSDLKKLNPMYWKREKHTEGGKTTLRIVPGTGPTLYSKLIFSKKNDKFLTQFFSNNDEKLEPLDLIGKYCYANAAVKIESIFIGNKISMQLKLYEAVVEPMQAGMKRLLSRPKAQSKVLAAQNMSNAAPMGGDDDDEDDDVLDDGSINGSDVEEEPKKVAAPTKRRVVKKVGSKK